VLDPVLAKKPFWKKDYTTVSGMEVNPLATPLSVADDDFHEITYPGQFPYTRGIHPTGYRGRLWTMRQFAGFGAQQTNERFRTSSRRDRPAFRPHSIYRRSTATTPITSTAR
jgi:methylmalonyl-CoA mutase N-terminal domain/subunit